MKISLRKKFVVYLIALGLGLNGFCMNLLTPKTAMAMSMNAPAMTMHESAPETMPMTEKVANCGDMNMNANVNCCFVPASHGSDKSFEGRTPQVSRQHLHVPAMKVGTSDSLETRCSHHHHRHFHPPGGTPSSSSLTGQIVKKE